VSRQHIVSTVRTGAASTPGRHPGRPRRRVATTVVVGLVLSLAALSPAAAGDAPEPEPAPPGTVADTSANPRAQQFFGDGLLAAAPYLAPMAYNGEVRGVVGAWAGFTNGGIPTTALCSPSWSTKKARCDAVAALEAMNAEYKATFGVNMYLTSTYRTYAEQEALHNANPVGAAAPGTSNHGWALAIDFGGGINTFGTAQHNWMRSNSNRFGWFQPAWAQYYGSLPEAWHWEYAGAVASGRAGHSQALGMEIARMYSWNSAAQRECLVDLWQLRTGWDFRYVGTGDQRGLSKAPMTQLFGASWTSSSEATKWLQIPQRQVEWGLLDITRNFGNPCAAWDYWGPEVTATVTGPTTVPADVATTIDVTYDKERAPVAAAGLTVQRKVDGAWVDESSFTVVDGETELEFSPGTTSGTFRVRNWDASAVSEQFNVNVAELTAAVTGPTTVRSGGQTTVTLGYSKDDTPVPSATLTLQKLTDGAWVDAEPVPVTNGAATHTLRLTTSTTFRVRNWNTSLVTDPFTISVAEVDATLTGPQAVAPGGTTTVGVRYTKDGVPVASATLTLQVQRDGEWVDVTPVTVTDGAGSTSVRPAETAQYRARNWNGTAVSAPVTLVVAVTAFSDVAQGHPLRASIEWLALQGITTGFPDGTFRPSLTVTRDSMAAFLYRLAGRPAFTPPAVSPFADVATSHPFYLEITWLASRGITTGTPRGDGTVLFKPTAPVARDAMAAFLYRFAGSPAFADPATSPFTDVGTGHPFYTEIAWLEHEGIATGSQLPGGTFAFSPTGSVTREAMAAFLHRFSTR